AINDFVRNHLKEKGELGKGANFVVTDIVGKKHVREFAPGDKVIFLKKGVFDNHFISKDDVGHIKEISGKNITFSIQGKDVVISMDRYDHIDHAHCRTTYRVQGADYSNVFANIDTRQSMINSRNDFLVKISRAINKLELFTDDRYKLYEAISREQFKVCINDFKDEFYRKAEQQVISRMLAGMANRDFENDPLPKKVIEDLHRADANYIKYLQLKGVAGDELSKADSLFKSRFSSMKAQREAEAGVSNYIDIEKKAAAYESKSKRYYRRAMVKYTAILSRQEVLLEGEKIDRAQLQERFERTYVPGGSLATLGDFAAGKGVNPEEAIENCFSDLEMPHNSPGPEVGEAGQEQDAPGLDGSVEDGGIVPGGDGGEGKDGGGSGPGISFGT
ncbi:MAG: hypothetical protein KAW12_27025, partial [Candidatus Aminicenantes bacterium]|nr:hypothetical protein [Candidatus Aminicenantes bacterium]